MVIDRENRRYVLEFAAGYIASAILLFGWSIVADVGQPIAGSDED
jgi:hypothetical protein